MIRDALLWVSNPAILLQRVGGLSVLERQLHSLGRAGLSRVWISTDRSAAAARGLRLPPGLEIFWTDRGITSPAECRPPYLVVSGSHFIRVETLAHIVRGPELRSVAFLDGQKAAVVQIVAACGGGPASSSSQPLPEGTNIPLQHPVHNELTLDWLMAAGIKSQDGFMARHFDRRISLAISRALLGAPVSPNMMTLFSCLLGLAGTTFFLRHARSAHLAGAALVWLHSVLDGCDGELARIRFQESSLGGDIDFWGDNIVHLSLFGCLGAGFACADASVLPLFGGAAAMLGIFGSALLVYRQRLARRRTAEPSCGGEAPRDTSGMGTTLARLEIFLEQRDFIYLLLVLAYFGHTYEFLWAGAVGALLFFFMMIYLGRANREQSFQPHRAG